MPMTTDVGVIILGVSAAAALLIAGYLFGVIRGRRTREQFHQEMLDQAGEAQRLQVQIASEQASATTFRHDLGKMLDVMVKQGDILQHMAQRLVDRDTRAEELRAVIQQALAPLIRREQLALDLASVHAVAGQRGNLTHLLNEIAAKGHFGAVLLSDDHGLPLAASSSARELDRLAMMSSLVVLFADRLSRNGAPAPLSLIVHDGDNRDTLCRIFYVGDQRLLLTAVSTGVPLSPMGLDATLQEVNRVLSQPVGMLSPPS
jgi:hypothetical protein